MERVETRAGTAAVLVPDHPSSILRAPGEESRREETRLFVEDLKKVARMLAAE